MSRVSPGAISPELLRGFHENDTDHHEFDVIEAAENINFNWFR